MASKKKPNFSKKRKKGRITKKEHDVDDELSLQDVLDVGGDKVSKKL